MFLQADLSEVVKFVNQCNRDYYLGWTFCGERDGRAAWYRDPEVVKVKEVPLAQGVVSIEYDILPSGESEAFKKLERYLLKRFPIPTSPELYHNALQPEAMRIMKPILDWVVEETLKTGNQPDISREDTQARFKAQRENEMIGTAAERARGFLDEGLLVETPDGRKIFNADFETVDNSMAFSLMKIRERDGTNFQRETITPTLTNYYFLVQPDNPFGRITVRKVSANQTEISFADLSDKAFDNLSKQIAKALKMMRSSKEHNDHDGDLALVETSGQDEKKKMGREFNNYILDTKLPVTPDGLYEIIRRYIFNWREGGKQEGARIGKITRNFDTLFEIWLNGHSIGMVDVQPTGRVSVGAHRSGYLDGDVELELMRALCKHILVECGVSIESPPATEPIIVEAIASRDSSPWELIPDHLWDRDAVKMWYNGSTGNEIGKQVGVSTRAVHNLLSLLRRIHPNAGIETANQRQKRFIRERKNL